MRGHEKWEAYLRPILDRLKKIDGRAPVSIMTCQIDPDDPHLQTWLKEGVSLEMHTIDHPCPILGKGDFAAAKATYDRCVDLLGVGPEQQAGRVPHAVLRLAQHAQPAALRRDLQQDHAEGELPPARQLGLQRLHARTTPTCRASG